MRYDLVSLRGVQRAETAAAGAQVWQWHCGHSGAALNPANASGFAIEAEHLAEDMFDPVDMQLAVEVTRFGVGVQNLVIRETSRHCLK